MKSRLFTLTLIITITVLLSTIFLDHTHTSETLPSIIQVSGGTGIIKTTGLAPTSISLSWRQDTSPSYDRYTLQQSSSSTRPWISVYNSTSGDKSEAAFFVTGLIGGQSYLWRLLGIGSDGTEHELDNVQIVQPDYDRLDDFVRGGSVSLNWTNNAVYGGGISFVSYTIYESVNNSARSSIATIDRVDVRNFSVNNLSSKTDYAFTVETLVKCTKCNVSTVGRSLAGPVDVLIVGSFPLSLKATRVSADLGQTITFTCDTSKSPGPVDKVEISFADDTTVLYTIQGSQVTNIMNDTRIVLVECNATSGAYRGQTSVPVTVSTDPVPTSPTIIPAMVETGQSVTFSTIVTGGLPGYSYTWKLPDGCEPKDSQSIPCQPNTPGTYIVQATIVDQNGFQVSTGQLSFTVYAGPMINSLTASRSLLKTGEETTLTVSASNGHGPLSYSYVGLPRGCASYNTTVLHCTPTGAGRFPVHVTVTDIAGGSATSNLILNVEDNPGNPSSPSLAPTNPNGLIITMIIGGILAATAAISLILVLKRRPGSRVGQKQAG